MGGCDVCGCSKPTKEEDNEVNENIRWQFVPHRADNKTRGTSLSNHEYSLILKMAKRHGYTPVDSATGSDSGGAERFSAALRSAARELEGPARGWLDNFMGWLEGEGRWGYMLSRGWGNLLGNHSAMPSRVEEKRPPARFVTFDAAGKKAVVAQALPADAVQPPAPAVPKKRTAKKQ